MAANKGRVAVITGASSGIGLEAAKALAAEGFRIIGTGRDQKRMEAAIGEIKRAGKGGRVEMLNANLSLMSDTARLAREITARTDRIDLLLNNAGGTPSQQSITEEGYEATFTGNHLGHFLLTHRLLPLLRAAAKTQPKGSVRIINTSSSAHEHSPGFDWDDLQMLKKFAATPSYMNAKLANVYFTRSLAKRLAPDGIVVHAVHPGMVATNFSSYGDEAMQKHFVVHAERAISAAAGADTLIWAATSPEAGKTTGGYFYERKPGTVSAPGQDEAAAERLWRESEALVAKVGQAVA